MESDRPPPFLAALGDRYTMERELGSGASATVFLADDVKHRRKVAVKVFRSEFAATIGPERFLREIETAARLSHPHILPLYDSGAADGTLYFVMPFVRGESLRQKLTREKRLPIAEAIRLTRQVAAALEFAHSEGVLHRDIKPENILLHEGEAMVADFGIALTMHGDRARRLTGTGMLVGTPEYMSPEQAVGDAGLDPRSDVYSLGCVLYEMLAGVSPHAGPTALAMIARRLSSPARGVRRSRSAVPVGVERALAKALATEPAERFESAAAFAEALGDDVEAVRPRVPCVGVLPFLNLSTSKEHEYFADGITEDVIAQLSRIAALKVISRTSVMQFKQREQSLQEIGAALQATALLEGSVRHVGDRVRIVAQLIDVETDQHLWAETYDRRLTDIFVIQTDVALHIAAALRAELTGDEKSRIRKEPTADVEAYRLYLQGRHSLIRFDEDGLRTSIEYFELALARDASYAMAYVGLAIAYMELGQAGALNPEESYRRGKVAARQALALDDELGEAHAALAGLMYVSDFDWAGAEQGLQRALELTPGNADTWDLYGRLHAALGNNEEAIAMLKRAQELDPLAHRADVATAMLRAGAHDEALRLAMHVIELDPHYARGHATAAWAYVKKEMYAQGISHLETAVALSPGDTLWLSQLGQIFGMAGQTDKARDVLRQLEDLARRKYVSPYHMAYVHTGLGELDRAMDYLESAYDSRAGAIYGIKGSFLFTSLHSHPRFQALLRRMKLD